MRTLKLALSTFKRREENTIALEHSGVLSFSGTFINIIDESGPIIFETFFRASEGIEVEMSRLAMNYEQG